jgi:DNA-directed RNA polymerase subunit RPC12/RpoP
MLNDAIFVSSEDDLIGLKKGQKIKYICVSCGNEVERLFIRKRLDLIKRFKCKKCNSEQTCLERYGYKNGAQVPEFKEKFQSTSLERYGSICSLNGEEQIKKKKETWQKNFGASNPWQKKEVREKLEQANLQKYGTKYAFTTQESHNKSLQTRLEKRNFGHPIYFYDNLKFDSSWEVCFYIYMKDSGHSIKRNDKVVQYESNGKQHVTTVDFTIDEAYHYEVKSKHWIHDKTQQDRLNAILAEGVILIDDLKIKEYIEYVRKTYGPSFIKHINRSC